MREQNYNTTYDAIIMGGSWGGLNAVTHILETLPEQYSIPIVVVLHRGKNYASDLTSIIQRKVKLAVTEIEEKQKMSPGQVYLAPANYHVLIEEDWTFSFDLSKPVNYSRPSIDVAFESAAEVFTTRLMGILLTGANKDGAQGLKTIAQKGGFTMVQDPLEAESGTMPKSALEISNLHRILTLNQMKALLIGLHALAI